MIFGYFTAWPVNLARRARELDARPRGSSAIDGRTIDDPLGEGVVEGRAAQEQAMVDGPEQQIVHERRLNQT